MLNTFIPSNAWNRFTINRTWVWVKVLEMGYEEDHTINNIKLFIMALACVFALVAQFWPQPFPESRPLLASCCIRSVGCRTLRFSVLSNCGLLVQLCVGHTYTVMFFPVLYVL